MARGEEEPRVKEGVREGMKGPGAVFTKGLRLGESS